MIVMQGYDINHVVTYMISTNLVWGEAGTSASAEGGSHSAETRMTALPPQDKATEEVSVDAASAASPTGMCLVNTRVVEVLMESYAAAPELGTNLLAEIEAEVENFTALEDEINLLA